jgi:hypothetical protein
VFVPLEVQEICKSIYEVLLVMRVELFVEAQKNVEERMVWRSNGCVLQDLVPAIDLQHQPRCIEWVIFPFVYGLARPEVSVSEDSAKLV